MYLLLNDMTTLRVYKITLNQSEFRRRDHDNSKEKDHY